MRTLLITLSVTALSVFGGYKTADKAEAIKGERIAGHFISQRANNAYLKFYIENENVDGTYVLVKTGQDGNIGIQEIKATSPNQLGFPLLHLFVDENYPYLGEETS